MNRTIEVVVSPEREVQVQTTGFAGSTCQQASRSVEEALEIRERERFTGGYYQAQTTRQHQQAQS